MPPQQKSIASFFTKPRQNSTNEPVEAKENHEVPSHPPDKEAVDVRETKKRRLVKNESEKEPNQQADEVSLNIPTPCGNFHPPISSLDTES